MISRRSFLCAASVFSAIPSIALSRQLEKPKLAYKTNKYIESYRPRLHPRQIELLSMTDKTVLFGYSPMCSKTECILLTALQYIDVPGQSSIIFKESFSELRLPGGIVDRSHDYLGDSDARWSERDKQWRFPNGNVLSFGFANHKGGPSHYCKPQYSYVGFDEVGEVDPVFYFTVCDAQSANIGFRTRIATNPGGTWGDFYSLRYVPQAFYDCKNSEKFGMKWTSDIFRYAKFLPARVNDNPSIDAQYFERIKSHISPDLFV